MTNLQKNHIVTVTLSYLSWPHNCWDVEFGTVGQIWHHGFLAALFRFLAIQWLACWILVLFSGFNFFFISESHCFYFCPVGDSQYYMKLTFSKLGIGGIWQLSKNHCPEKGGLSQKELSSIRELLSNYEELSSTSEVSSLRPRGPAQRNTSPNSLQLSLKLSPMMLLSLSVSDTQPNNHLVCPFSPAAPPPPPPPPSLLCSLSLNASQLQCSAPSSAQLLLCSSALCSALSSASLLFSATAL